MPKYGDAENIGETGTLRVAPPKGPARSTSADWEEPNTRPLGDDKSDGSAGSVENVGKNAGRLPGKKEARVKIW